MTPRSVRIAGVYRDGDTLADTQQLQAATPTTPSNTTATKPVCGVGAVVRMVQPSTGGWCSAIPRGYITLSQHQLYITLQNVLIYLSVTPKSSL